MNAYAMNQARKTQSAIIVFPSFRVLPITLGNRTVVFPSFPPLYRGKQETETRRQTVTFYQWLTEQKDRDDPVGDLACDAMATDCSFARGKAGYIKWYSHLKALGACSGAIDALRVAYREYVLARGQEAELPIGARGA